jgi:hypothetical protein
MHRCVTKEGEWVFGTGKQSYVTGIDRVLQDLETSIKEWREDCFFNKGKGIDWKNIIGSKNQNEVLELAIRDVAVQIKGITAINEIIIYLDSNRLALLSIEINTVYGKEIQYTIDL